MDKLKFAFYWSASCGGCEIAVLDINEKLLDVINIADIVFWPVAIDTKYKDIEDMSDKSIDICFFNGAIRNSENEYMAKLLRDKSKILVAFGSCAHEGGVIGLANLWDKEAIFGRVYKETPSTDNAAGTVPTTFTKVLEGELELPEFYNTVRALDQVVNVDYYLPGCPPQPSLIVTALEAIAKNQLPSKGSILGPKKSICDECYREKKERRLSKIRRIWEIIDDEKTCFWDQGIPCMGPSTRAGCGAQCLQVNIPCTGCQGPGPNVLEQGSAMATAISSIIVEDNVIDQIVDPVGTFYKYSVAHSILGRRRMK